MMRKVIGLVPVIGFLGVGGVLATSHPGFAVRVVNYFYFVVFASVLFSLAYEKKK